MSDPKVANIVELVTKLKGLGALQICWGDFQCTLSPPSDFSLFQEAPPLAPLTERVTQPAPGEPDDDLFATQSEAQKMIDKAKELSKRKAALVERDLFAASEMRD